LKLNVPPVLLVAFNRPKETKEVFEQIRLAQPSKLYIACDASRPSRAGEFEQVRQVRMLASQVDWPCEVKTRFLDENQSCARAVSSAIDWFLTDAGEGIILEDDCLPTPAFFRFCTIMLDRYRDCTDVAIIAGSNLSPLIKMNESYGFSRLFPCWGWATWRRTWSIFNLQTQPIKNDEEWIQYLSPGARNHLKKILVKIESKKINSWAYPLAIQILRFQKLIVVPRENLILNIGFGGNGAHYSNAKRPWWVPECAINSCDNWNDSPALLPNHNYDYYYQAVSYSGCSKLYRVFLKIRYWLKRLNRHPNPYFSDTSNARKKLPNT